MSFTDTDVDLAVPINGAPSRPKLNAILKSLPRSVSTIAELRELPSNPGNGLVYVQSYAVAGDGGGGWFQYTTDDISAYVTAQTYGGTDHAFLVVAIDGQDGSTGGFLRIDRWKTGTLAFAEGGGAPIASGMTTRQKATANFNAFQAAQQVMVQLVADGFAKPVLLWPGRQIDFENYGQGSMNLLTSQKWKGEGMDQTKIYYYDRSTGTTSRQDLFRTTTGGIVNFEINDLTTESDFGVASDYTTQSQLYELQVTGTCRIERLRVTKSRFMGFICQDAELFTATECEITDCPRDGIRPLACESVSITDNYIARIGDDAIACHSRDDRKTGQPVQRAVVITGNKIEEALGITCLGMKTGVIADNVLRRIVVRGITVIVSPNLPEGNNALYDISITNNTIEDVFFGFGFLPGTGDAAYGLGGYAIHIKGLLDANSSGNLPWDDDGSGGVVDPLDSIYTRDADTAATGCPGAFGITVTGNKIRRTLKPVAAWADYGFGDSLFTKNGPYTGDVVITDFGNRGILVEDHLRDAVFDNIISGFDRAYDFDLTSATTYVHWSNVEIRGIIDRFGTRGIRATGKGILTVRDVRFNGDPVHEHADRAANGKWDNNPDNIALDDRASSTLIFDVQRCHFRNCGRVLNGDPNDNATYERHRIVNNRLCGTPALACLVGWNADNVGVGWLPRVSAFSEYEEFDEDPTSATFGQSLRIRPWRQFTPSISFAGVSTGITYNTTVTKGQVRAVDGVIHEVGRVLLTAKGAATGEFRINLVTQRGGDEAYPNIEVGQFYAESAFAAGFNDQIIGISAFANEQFARLRLHDNAAATTRNATDADILATQHFTYSIQYTAD